MKDIDNIKKDLKRLDEYIKQLKEKKDLLEKNNLKKKLLISQLKILNEEE